MYYYNNGIRLDCTRPSLYFVKDSEAKKFKGKNIKDFCEVVASQYEKKGKWSNTTYQINISQGVRPICFFSPKHNSWGNKLDSWERVAKKLDIRMDIAQAIIRNEYECMAERLDKIKAFNKAEIVIVSFSLKENCKIGKTSDGRKVIVKTGQNKYGLDWNNPVVVEPEGAEVLSFYSSKNIHEEFYIIEVIVPNINIR